MSITDPSAEPVQPDEGQGGEQAQADSPYSDYLNRLPEEVRGDVEPIFKEWDANVTKRFQDASEYRKGWEPFEQLGVNQRDPQEVQWALDMLEAAKTNPQGVAQWYDAYSQQHGLNQQQQNPGQQQQPEEDYVDPQVKALQEQLQQTQQFLGQIGPQLQGLTQWQQEQQQAYQHQVATQQVQQAWDEVKAKSGADWSDERVEQFLGNHLDKEPKEAIEAALNDWVSLKNQIAKDALQSKADVPQSAEAGGTADGSPEKIDSLKQAAQIAMEQLRGNRSM